MTKQRDRLNEQRQAAEHRILRTSKQNEHVTLRRDGDAPLRFKGALMASVSTRNQRERWTELYLYSSYHTETYVAQQIARTTVEGEMDRHTVWICTSAKDLRSRVGDGPLARQLYLEAGLDGIEVLEQPMRGTRRKRDET